MRRRLLDERVGKEGQPSTPALDHALLFTIRRTYATLVVQEDDRLR